MAFALLRNFGGEHYAFEYASSKREANKYAEKRRKKGKKVRVVKGRMLGKSQYGVYTRD